MGYTHYFAYTPNAAPFRRIWLQLRLDAAAITALVQHTGLIDLAGADGRGRPRTDEDTIAVNGSRAGGEDWAPLEIDLDAATGPGGFTYRFLATGPLEPLAYDVAVTAILLRAHRLAPDHFAIGSDGPWDRGWFAARTVHAYLFGPPPARCPFTPALRRLGPPAARDAPT